MLIALMIINVTVANKILANQKKNDLLQLCISYLQAKRKNCTLSYQKQREVMQDIHQSFKNENLNKLESS